MNETAHSEQPGGSRKPRHLDQDEIDALIARNCWGVLAMVSDGTPYAVQIIYGYDGHSFVFANGPGRKVDVLEDNPQVSLVITEVEEHGKRWRSVVVKGTVEWIEDFTARLSAFNTLRKQIPFSAQRMRDAAKLASAKVARIVPSEITGRAAGA
ncbi:MAG TPA: pyridoxamine 5'-phosphate oxidase family protein [Longimicrobiales bacterium]|nr:pyridoxamine 5'-phosphate oxidase family protein [Longimicrobiales bacterium]